MGQNAPAGRPLFFSPTIETLEAGRRVRSGPLEPCRIPAKIASTPQLNAMGIAPKVVGERFGDPLLLMLRLIASQILLCCR